MALAFLEAFLTRNWFRTLFARPVVRKSPKSCIRPALEVLEDRTVPSTFTVANGLDTGTGSLRAAVALANANPDADTINFAPGVTAVTLTTGQLTLSTDMNITGSVTIARSSAVGTPEFRIFEVATGATVGLTYLKVTGGRDGFFGGGIYNSGTVSLVSSTITANSAGFGGGGIVNLGTMTLSSSTVSANTAFVASQGVGAGISNFGHLTVKESTLSDNTAAVAAGAIDNGGVLTILSSTISGNVALSSGGGGIISETGSTLTVTSSTVSGNKAAIGNDGGGIFIYGLTATINNTIVANSTGEDLFAAGGTFVGTGNLVEDGSGGATLGKILGDPNLGALADNGGPTLTHALLPGSIAIDAGVQVFGEIEDQRFFPRPIGGFDIGAVESGGTSVGLIVTRADDVTDPNDGLTTLREAVNLANANPDASAITFAPGISTVTLTQGTLSLTSIVTISGPLGGTVTVTRGASAPDFGIFSVAFNGTVQLANLTITKGRAGGGIDNLGALRITASTITDNTGGGLSGGGITNDGTLVVVASTISNNSADFGGGIASGITNSETATAKVVNSTLSANTATQLGGGIYDGNFFDGTFTVRSSTIAGNGASQGGGIYYDDAIDHMELDNTIVADSMSGGDLAASAADRFVGSGNLVEDGSGGASLGKISGDPNLGPLANNGGPTKTHALLGGSIAINAGVNALAAGLTTDQRGFNRFVGTVDIGAFESQVVPLTLTASTATAVPGLAVTFTATLPANATGTVAFREGTTVLGTATISGGVATLTVVFDTYGSHVVSASYPASTTATASVSVVPAALLPDALNPGQRALFVGGTPLNDLIGVDRLGNNRYAVGILSLSGFWPVSAWEGVFEGAISRVVVYGGDGNDVIAVDNDLKSDAWLYGGNGNDLLIGGGGNDVLMGGAGNDVLTARGGRDILIGGTGADALFGGSGGDLLIAGSTAFDTNEVALSAIQDEWTSNRDTATRVANLRGTGTGPRANAGFFLKASGAGATVFSDSSVDCLTGGSGRDWFFANALGGGVLDSLFGRKSDDILDDLP